MKRTQKEIEQFIKNDNIIIGTTSMKNYFFIFIIFLSLLTILPTVFGDDTLKIDTKLTHDFDTHYNFPKQTPLVLTGNHDMCPSNDCKMIFDKYVDAFIGTGITLNMEPNKMTLNGYLKLTGSGEDKWIMEWFSNDESIPKSKKILVSLSSSRILFPPISFTPP